MRRRLVGGLLVVVETHTFATALAEPSNVGSSGKLSDDPLAGLPSWRTVHVDPGSTLTGAACPSPSECLAVDQAGDAVVGTPARIPTPTRSRPRIIGEPRVG